MASGNGQASDTARARGIVAAQNSVTGHPRRDTIEAICDTFAAEYFKPRPLDEWHEDHGPVMWWFFPITEPPYVGSPLDCGHTVEVEFRTRGGLPITHTHMVGGWPGYHTHWTPLPPCPKEPT